MTKPRKRRSLRNSLHIGFGLFCLFVTSLILATIPSWSGFSTILATLVGFSGLTALALALLRYQIGEDDTWRSPLEDQNP